MAAAAEGDGDENHARRPDVTATHWLIAGTIVALILLLCAIAYEAGRTQR